MALEALSRRHRLLRRLLVLPEVWRRHPLFDLRDLSLLLP